MASIHSEGTTVPSAGLLKPASARLIEQATSQASGLPSHISPQSSQRIGKQPAYGSVSDVSENVLQHAVHNASRGTHISPTSIKSAGSFKTQHYETKPQVLQSGGANIYAPQPQIPQAAIQEYYGAETGMSGGHYPHYSPTTEYKKRKDSSVAPLEPPHMTATPTYYVEVVVEDIFTREEIHSESHKQFILDTVNTRFNEMNRAMGRNILPHENLKMYIHSLVQQNAN